MDENQSVDQGATPAGSGGTDMGLVTYICFAVGFVTGGLGSIVGVVLAYLQRDDAAGTWQESHYTWLIRTFWIGFLGGIISIVLTFVIIGIFTSIALLVWFIVRIVKGWMAYDKKQPIANPESWMFG